MKLEVLDDIFEFLRFEGELVFEFCKVLLKLMEKLHGWKFILRD